MGDDQIVARRIAPPSTRLRGHLATVICVPLVLRPAGLNHHESVLASRARSVAGVGDSNARRELSPRSTAAGGPGSLAVSASKVANIGSVLGLHGDVSFSEGVLGNRLGNATNSFLTR